MKREREREYICNIGEVLAFGCRLQILGGGRGAEAKLMRSTMLGCQSQIYDHGKRRNSKRKFLGIELGKE